MTRITKGILPGMIILLLAPLQIWADPVTPPVISAETRINPRQATIGDPVIYSIIVRHEPGIHVLPPNPLAFFKKGFEYIDQGSSESKNTEGQQEKTFWFKFRADAVGFYNLPEIPVEFTAPATDNPSQHIPGILQAPKAVVEIRSVLFQDGEPSDIKDIKPIIGAEWDWRKYLHWVLWGLAALAGLGLMLWQMGRSRKPASAVSVPAPKLKPHETALNELDRLLNKKLIENGQFREHYFEFSEIFRRYLGSLLSIPALDWTTEEISSFISRSNQLNSETRQKVLALLRATDRIKFAKAPVALSTALQHVEAMRDFVRNMTPEMTSKFQIKTPVTV